MRGNNRERKKSKTMLNTIKNSDMKKALKLFLITGIFMSLSMLSIAQSPPHPNGGNAPGGGNTPVGGGAPIGSGLIIMLSLATGWGAKKSFTLWKSQKSIQ